MKVTTRQLGLMALSGIVGGLAWALVVRIFHKAP